MSLVLSCFVLPAKLIFKPRPELLAKIAGDEDAQAVLGDTVMWSAPYGGLWRIPPAEVEREFLARARLIFLGSLIAEYGRPPWLERILGTGPIELATFDRWWTLEAYQDDSTLDEEEKKLRASQKGLFKKTGNEELDEWLGPLVDS